MTTELALRQAKARWACRRRRRIACGTWEPFVPAAPVRAHVEAIRATGMAVADIARHTGVNRGSLDHLLWGSRHIPPATKVRPETAAALLAFWPTLNDYADAALIDPTGTLRRVRALAATGWTWTGIASHIGTWDRSTFERLHQKQRVTACLARAARDMYNEVGARPAEEYGTAPWVAERSRARARRRGWPDPTWWEDYGGIDDPGAPDTVQPEVETPRAVALAEDWEWLAAQGYSRQQAAERLGVDRHTLDAAISRTRRATLPTSK